MTVINNGFPDGYFSQRNNRRDPYAACNVTAMVDAAVAARWPMPEPKADEDPQPEDRLMLFIETDSECRHLWATLDPAGKIPPNQWMSVLCLGLNRWIGEPIAQFAEAADWRQMVGQLALGGTCVVCGDFPRTSGHVVALVGAEMEGAQVINWIIDDPYGNYLTNYESERGDDVRMPHADFLRILRTSGSERKWCHFIRPNGPREA